MSTGRKTIDCTSVENDNSIYPDFHDIIWGNDGSVISLAPKGVSGKHNGFLFSLLASANTKHRLLGTFKVGCRQIFCVGTLCQQSYFVQSGLWVRRSGFPCYLNISRMACPFNAQFCVWVDIIYMFVIVKYHKKAFSTY